MIREKEQTGDDQSTWTNIAHVFESTGSWDDAAVRMEQGLPTIASADETENGRAIAKKCGKWTLVATIATIFISLAVYFFLAAYNYPRHIDTVLNVTETNKHGTSLSKRLLMESIPGCREQNYSKIKLNHMQLIGTHNSYKTAPSLALHRRLKYAHESIATQLAHAGMRHFELDLHPSSDNDTEFRIFHLPVIDHTTHCRCLAECVRQMKEWSDSVNGTHTPIYVLLDIKMSLFGDVRTFSNGLRLDQLVAIENQLLSVWGRDRIITPSDVQQSYGSLRDAVTNKSWPSVEDSLGKIVFLLLDALLPPTQRSHVAPSGEVTDLLLQPGPPSNVAGERILFALHTPSDDGVNLDAMPDDTAFVRVLSPFLPGNSEMMEKAVDLGYMVRARVHRSFDNVMNNAELMLVESLGVQLVSTDQERHVDPRCCPQSAKQLEYEGAYTSFARDGYLVEKCSMI